jgi:hypothetical protein
VWEFLAVRDSELMAQREDLGIFGTLASAAQHQQVDHKSDETVETSHVSILIDPSRADQIETAKSQVKTQDRFSVPIPPSSGRCRRTAGVLSESLVSVSAGKP